MRMKVLKNCVDFKHSQISLTCKILFILFIFKNVISVNSYNLADNRVNLGLGSSLVILTAVNAQYAFGATILGHQENLSGYFSRRLSKQVQSPETAADHRNGKQISILGPALQTMGCLPKFFCGMNSKKPTDDTTTINDLAYLIKYAMRDDVEDSGEQKGKDALMSNEDSDEGKTSSERRKETLKFERLAEEQLIMDDPQFLTLLWKDTKAKIRSKLKHPKVDDQVLDEMIADYEIGQKKKPSKLSSLFSGIKSLVRFGRSVDKPKLDPEIYARKSEAFWDTEEFDHQMNLAARIGKTSENEEQCTSTFNLCPYTVHQMKSMVTGTGDGNKHEKIPIPQQNWYVNSNGPKEIETTPKPTHPPSKKATKRRPTTTKRTTPSPLSSNVIYLLDPSNKEGQKPTAATTTTTRRPKPSNKIKTTVRPPKPYFGVKDMQDDEVGYDNPSLTFKDVLKLTTEKPESNEKEENEGESDEENKRYTSSEEEESDDPLRKISKSKLSKNRKDKTKIGMPKRKYTIRHKYKNANLQGIITTKHANSKEASPESVESVPSPKLKEIKGSEEKSVENSKEDSEEEGGGAFSSEELVDSHKNKTERDMNGNMPHKYVLKNRPENKLEFKKIEEEEDASQEEMSDENENDDDQRKKEAEIEESSEEENGTKKKRKQSQHFREKSKDSDEYEEKDPSLQLHPIKYSYFSKGGSHKQPNTEAPSSSHQSPKPTAASSGGFFSSWFGKKKTPQKIPTNSYEQRPPPKITYIQDISGSESKETSSEEKQSKPIQRPQEHFEKERIPDPARSSEERDKHQPIIMNHPNPTVAEIKPTLKTKKSRPTKKKVKQPKPNKNKFKDDKDSEEEADTSGSKEEDLESDEEKDLLSVKNMFSKGTISSLGTDPAKDDEDEHIKTVDLPPPPPPIANWKQPSIPSPNSTTPTTTTTTLKPKLEVDDEDVDKVEASDEEKEDDSAENGNGDSNEILNEKQSDEGERSEEDEERKKPAGEDDEVDNKEPVIVPADENIPQLGDVVAIDFKPMIFKQPQVVPATGSGFESTNEIKIPISPPTPSPSPEEILNNGMTMALMPMGSQDATIVESADPKATPNAATPNAGVPAAPGGAPGGGSPGGRLPGTGGNRRPGGGNNNRNPTGNNNQETDDSSEEEKVGKESSEEVGEASSEEISEGGGDDDDEDDDPGRTSLISNTTSAKINNNKVIIKKNKSRPVKMPRPGQSSGNNKGTNKRLSTITVTPQPINPPIYYAPLPPIYKWKTETTPITKRVVKENKTPKPLLRRPRPTKDTFYTKPLSPKLVTYLRETYGNSFVSPKKKSSPTSKPKLKFNDNSKKGKGSKKSAPALVKTFSSTKLGGLKSSDVIQLDEFEHDKDFINYSQFLNRQGVYSGGPVQTLGSTLSMPPIYGQIHMHG